jgi:hypothetical protein
MYLRPMSEECITHSMSRVIGRSIDSCALPAADPLDPGPIVAWFSPFPSARRCGPSEPGRIHRTNTNKLIAQHITNLNAELPETTF